MRKLKALSPLIATILLVAVSLSLAGILYSWASQNAKDTASSFSDSQAKWDECNNIQLDIEQNCKYSSEDGISFILYDRSSTEITGNIVLTVIDSEGDIETDTFPPNFKNGVMSIKNNKEVAGLKKPIYLVKIHLDTCPEKGIQTKVCG